MTQVKRPLAIAVLCLLSLTGTWGIRHIYKSERANGFNPYVATIKLDRIVREPNL